MANAIELLEYLKKYPTFDTTIVRDRISKNSQYANLLIHRLRKRGLIQKIERDKYTVFKDPFLIASRIVWPSYISCWSALKYHNLTEQVPHDLTVLTMASKKAVTFGNTKIRFVKLSPKAFFGYEKVKYESFEIFVADAEKSIIDSALLGEASFSELKEIMLNNSKTIKAGKFIQYLKRIANKSMIKRFGYVFEEMGKNYYGKLKRFVDATYIPLDYSKKPVGSKNEKWRLVINA